MFDEKTLDSNHAIKAKIIEGSEQKPRVFVINKDKHTAAH